MGVKHKFPVITTVNFLTFEDSGKDSAAVPEDSPLDIVERYFGHLHEIRFDAEYSTLTFLYDDIPAPESAIRDYVNEMKNIGATCYLHSFPADGGIQTFSVYWDAAEYWIGGRWTKSDSTLSISFKKDRPHSIYSSGEEDTSESGVPSD